MNRRVETLIDVRIALCLIHSVGFRCQSADNPLCTFQEVGRDFPIAIVGGVAMVCAGMVPCRFSMVTGKV